LAPAAAAVAAAAALAAPPRAAPAPPVAPPAMAAPLVPRPCRKAKKKTAEPYRLKEYLFCQLHVKNMVRFYEAM
jgi:hypothetical protein